MGQTRRNTLLMDMVAIPASAPARYVPLGLWALTIIVLSSIPGDSYPKVTFFQADKLVHFLIYMPGGVLVARALDRRRHCNDLPAGTARTKTLTTLQGAAIFRKPMLWWVSGAVFGATDEWHLLLVRNRSCSLYDWLVDVVALGTGVLLWIMFIESAVFRYMKPLKAEEITLTDSL